MAAEEVVGIRLALRDRQRTSQGLQATREDVKGIGDEAERTGSRASRGLAALQKISGTVARSARTGLVAITGLATAAAAFGVRTAAANEQAQISFTTMLGSATRARSFLGELAAFAAKTPFDFPGLQSSASKLLSAGIDAKKIIPIMTSLGNATSGMGTGSEGIERATVALQQMNAAGKISGEDLNQLRDAGIPVFDLLTAATGKSTAEIANMAAKGKLGRKELEQLMAALESGKGLDRFNGLMEAQSRSMTGMWSSFTDTVSQGLGKVLKPWLPALKVGLGALTESAGPFFDGLVDDSARLSKYGMLAVNTVRRAFRDAGPTIAAVSAYVRELIAQFRSGQGLDMAAVRDLAGSSATLVTNLPQLTAQLPSFNDALRVGGVVVGFLADHLDTIAYFMPVLAAGFLLYRSAIIASTAATIAELPLKAADILATQQLANANRALAFQLGLASGQQVRSRTAIIASTVVAGAQKVATLASAAATKIAALATRGFGAALRFAMGPVGWIITGIGLLAAGAVYAYQNFGWFRSGVDNAVLGLKIIWEWIKKVGSSVKTWLLDKLEVVGGWLKKWGPIIQKVLGFTPLGAAVNLATGNGLPSLPGRAVGGPVTAGRAYRVGESGEETFIPHTSGVIVPRPSPSYEEIAGSAHNNGGETRIVLQVDGRTLAEVLANAEDDREARR